MFVSMIELSPGSTLIELPVIIRRPTYDQCVCSSAQEKKASGDYPRSWMFHFETVIEMDFCLPSFTLWQTPKSQSSKFSVKVPKWFMNRGCMARGTAGGWVQHFPLSEISWRECSRLSESCQQMLHLNLWDPLSGWLMVWIGRPDARRNVSPIYGIYYTCPFGKEAIHNARKEKGPKVIGQKFCLPPSVQANQI